MPEVSAMSIQDNDSSSSPAARVSINHLEILRLTVPLSGITALIGPWGRIRRCSFALPCLMIGNDHGSFLASDFVRQGRYQGAESPHDNFEVISEIQSEKYTHLAGMRVITIHGRS